MRNLMNSYTRFVCIVYSGEVKCEVGTRSRMCCVGWAVGSGTFCCRLVRDLACVVLGGWCGFWYFLL